MALRHNAKKDGMALIAEVALECPSLKEKLLALTERTATRTAKSLLKPGWGH